jgi:hypothetical protein
LEKSAAISVDQSLTDLSPSECRTNIMIWTLIFSIAPVALGAIAARASPLPVYMDR